MDEESIFELALEKQDREARLAFLRDACGGDTERQQRIERLLAAHDKSRGILERGPEALAPTGEFARQSANPVDPASAVGSVIGGRYKLLECLGEGGMGTIYVAEQTAPVRRKVALKLIKPGHDSKYVLARFEAERQALALMDHPNIAKVLDGGIVDTPSNEQRLPSARPAGTESPDSASAAGHPPAWTIGRPYFVMEYIKGEPIDEYCDREKLSVRQRLELFVPVCQAVQHAHQKGIIHRDLKPSNILIALYDGQPVPKVIDFGLAKAMHQPLTERTLYTAHAVVLGTPIYMSPEQSEMNNFDVDTRTDVYSLGVILYELLTGTTPLERQRFKQAAWDEVLRIIREEEPVWPSTRLSSSQTLPNLAAQRATEPAKLSQLIKGDLDWIVMKALEKDRSRRYETANGIARDIQRYLADEPVEASPPSVGYRLRKLVRRYRLGVSVAASFAVLLLAATITTSMLAVFAQRQRETAVVERQRADEERRAAEAERDRAKRAKDAEAEQRISADLQRQEAVVARQLAENEKARADEKTEQLRRSLYVYHVSQAQRAFEQHQGARLRQMLDHCPEDRRGWEWQRLNALADISLLTLRGHTAAALCVDFSPDGRYLASGGDDGTARIWDRATGREVRALADVGGRVQHVRFSPDGNRLVTCTFSGLVKAWDAATFSEIRSVDLRANRVWCIALSADGNRLAVETFSQRIALWDITTGQLRSVRHPDRRVAGALAFSPDGMRLFAITYGIYARAWECATTGELLWSTKLTEGIPIQFLGAALTVSADGSRLTTVCEGTKVRILDATSGTMVESRDLETSTGSRNFTDAAINPDGTRIAAVGLDGVLSVWEVASGRERIVAAGHHGQTTGLSFSADGRFVATTGNDMTVRLWGMHAPQGVFTLRGVPGATALATSPDGGRIAVLDQFGVVTVRDSATGQLVAMMHGTNTVAKTAIFFGFVAFSPDGARLIASNSARGPGGEPVFTMWDARTGQELQTYSGHSAGPSCAAFSQDGNWIVSSAADGTVRLWETSSARQVRSWNIGKMHSRCVAISPNRQLVAAGMYGGNVRIWNAVTGELVHSIKAHPVNVGGLAFDQARERLVTCGFERTARVWDVATGNEVLQLEGHSDFIYSVDISPDGNRIVTASSDRTVRLWDFKAGEELLELAGHRHGLYAAVFTRDGKSIVSLSRDGEVKLWEMLPPSGALEMRELVAQAEDLVESLFQQHVVSDRVIEALKADAQLDRPLRDTAIQIATARGDNPNQLNRESWEVVKETGAKPEDVALALLKAQVATRLHPQNHTIVNTLATAQYRAGHHQEAITTIARFDSVNFVRQDVETFHDLAVLALAQLSLANFDDVHSALNRLRFLLDGAFSGTVNDLKPFVGELSIAIRKELESSPDDPRLHVALGTMRWIEGRLDEAAAEYRRAAELDGTYVAALTRLGCLLAAMNKAHDSAVVFRKALEIEQVAWKSPEDGPGASRQTGRTPFIPRRRDDPGSGSSSVAPPGKAQLFDAAESILCFANVLRISGEPAEAERLLRGVVEDSRLAIQMPIWNLWMEVCIGDLQRPVAELLREVPRPRLGTDWAAGRAECLAFLQRFHDEKALRINCGGGEYRTVRGMVFAPDRFFAGGQPHDYGASSDTPGLIEGTDDTALYQTNRWFYRPMQALPGYHIPVPSGSYRVTLHIAEIYNAVQQTGQRVFDILLEGQVVWEKYDPMNVGFATADRLTREITVNDGFLDIGFELRNLHPIVSAIEVTATGTPSKSNNEEHTK